MTKEERFVLVTMWIFLDMSVWTNFTVDAAYPELVQMANAEQALGLSAARVRDSTPVSEK